MSQPDTSSSKRSAFARCFGCFGSGLQTQEDASETPAGTCSIFLSFISGASCSRGGLDSSTAIRKLRGHARGADVVDVAAARYMDLFTANGNKAEESPGDVAVSACDAYDSDLRRTQDSIVRTTSDYQPSRQSFNVTATTSGPQPQLGSPTHPATRQSSSQRTSQRALDSFLCPHAEHGDADARPKSSPIAPRNASASTFYRPSTDSPSGPSARTPPHPGLQAFLSRGQGSASGSASSLGPTPSQTRISHPKRSRSDRYSASSSQVPPHGSGSANGSVGSGPAHSSPGPAVAESSGSAAGLPRARTLRHPHLGPGRVASSVSLSDLRHMARANGGSCTSLCAAPGAGPTTAPVVPPSAASGSLAAMAARSRRSRLSTELSLGAAAGPGATKSSGWCSGPVPHVDVSAASKASVGASAPAGAAAVQGAYRSPIVFERDDVRVTGLPPSCLTAGRAPRGLGPGGSPTPGALYSLDASGRTQDGNAQAADLSRHGPAGPLVQGPSSAPLRLPHSSSSSAVRTLSPSFRQPTYPTPPHGTVPDPQHMTVTNCSEEGSSQCHVGDSTSCGLDPSRFSNFNRLTHANTPLVFQPAVGTGYLDASDPPYRGYPAIESNQPQPSRTAAERPLAAAVGGSGSGYDSSSAVPVGRYAVTSGASAVSDALSRLHEACLAAVQECPEQRYQRRNSRLPTDKSSAQLARMYTYGSAGGIGPSWFDSDRPSDGHRKPATGPLHVLPSTIQVAALPPGGGSRGPSAPALAAAAASGSGLEEGESASILSPFTSMWRPDGDTTRSATVAETEVVLAEAGSGLTAQTTLSRQGEWDAPPGASLAVPFAASGSLTSSAMLPLPLSMLTMAHTVSSGDGAAPEAGAAAAATSDTVALDKLHAASGATPAPGGLDDAATRSEKLPSADCGMHSGRRAGAGAASDLPSTAGQEPGAGRWQGQQHGGEAGGSVHAGVGNEDDLHARRLMAALLDDFVPIEHHVAHHSEDEDDGYVEFRYDGFALGGEAREGSFVGARRPSARASPQGHA